jgi:hypothetical protein
MAEWHTWSWSPATQGLGGRGLLLGLSALGGSSSSRCRDTVMTLLTVDHLRVYVLDSFLFFLCAKARLSSLLLWAALFVVRCAPWKAHLS